MNRKIRIVTDSSSDVREISGVDYSCAPLKIITSDRKFVDDVRLDAEEMANHLRSYKGRSSTSCPNVEDWLVNFGDADEVFCVTITGTLSGSHNTAMTAKQLYEEENPGKRVFILDSLSTGPEIHLIVNKMRELILDGKDFDAVCEGVTAYAQRTGLLFMLESMKNLANNGRVSKLSAGIAGVLGIRVVGKASDVGDLAVLDKCRGEARALETIAKRLAELGYTGGKLMIGHCVNLAAAEKLAEIIRKNFDGADDIVIYQCRGLCTFYAERGGLLIGFEKG